MEKEKIQLDIHYHKAMIHYGPNRRLQVIDPTFNETGEADWIYLCFRMQIGRWEYGKRFPK